MIYTPAIHLNKFLSETHALTRAFAVPATETRKKLIDNTIRALMSASVWAKKDVLWVTAAHDSQAAGVNWKSPGSFTLTADNSPTFTANQGYTGNGTNARLLTGYVPSTHGVGYTLNSAHAACRVRTMPSVSEDKVVLGSGANLRIDPRRLTNFALARVNQNDNVLLTGATSTVPGHFFVNRSGAAAIQFRRDTTSLDTDATAAATSEAVPTTQVTLLSLDANSFSTAQISAAHLGASLTTGEMDAISGIFDTYMAGL